MHRLHATVKNRTTLAWDDAYDRHQADARLADLSRSETSLVAEAIPPTRQRVWLRLEHLPGGELRVGYPRPGSGWGGWSVGDFRVQGRCPEMTPTPCPAA